MSWLLDTLVVTGALIALVLVLRRPVARAFGPGMAYALWALPLLRLLLPPLVLPQAPAPVASEITVLAVSGQAASAAAPAATLPLTEIAFALWLGGALAFLLWRAWTYRAMRRDLLAEARPVGEAGAVRLVETPATAAPVAFGVLDKVVALPPGFMALADRAARDLALAHELEHHAGRDLAVNLAMQPLLALHWFNPLAWIGWRALRRDQEAACDARVLVGRDAITRARYGKLIAGFAQSPRLALAAPMACPISLGAGLGEKSIVHRLRSLTMTEPSPRRRLLGRALIGASALALPLTASIVYAASDPAPPTAPSPPEAPRVVKKVIVIEHRGDADPGNEKTITRTIERDGKTIVIKTDKDLSDAEVEAQVARIEAEMPAVPPVPAVPEVRVIEGPDGKRVERRIVIRHGKGEGGPELLALHGDREIACRDAARTADVSAEDSKDGKKQIVRMRICGHGAPAEALAAIRHARDGVASDGNLSPEIRDKVLRALDAEIDKLSKQG